MARERPDASKRAHNHLLVLEPEELLFTSVRLNQTYTQCVRITNPLNCELELEILAGNSDRFTVHPAKLRLAASQNALVEVKLRLRKPIKKPRGGTEQTGPPTHREIFHIKSTYFKQKFFALISMWGSLKPVPVTNESLSSIQQADVDRFQLEKNIDDMSEKMRVHSKSSRTQIEALETEVATLRRRLQQQKATAESDQREIQRQLDSEKTLHSKSKLQLEATKGALLQLERERSCYGNLHEMMQQQVPDVAAMVDILVANERDENEEKSQRVLKILESKDAMICDLQAALEKQRSELERLTGVIRAQTEQIQNGEDENRALHNDIELLREQSAANEDNLLQQLETLRSELDGAEEWHRRSTHLESELDTRQQQLIDLKAEMDGVASHLRISEQERQALVQEKENLSAEMKKSSQASLRQIKILQQQISVEPSNPPKAENELQEQLLQERSEVQRLQQLVDRLQAMQSAAHHQLLEAQDNANDSNERPLRRAIIDVLQRIKREGESFDIDVGDDASMLSGLEALVLKGRAQNVSLEIALGQAQTQLRHKELQFLRESAELQEQACQAQHELQLARGSSTVIDDASQRQKYEQKRRENEEQHGRLVRHLQKCVQEARDSCESIGRQCECLLSASANGAGGAREALSRAEALTLQLKARDVRTALLQGELTRTTERLLQAEHRILLLEAAPGPTPLLASEPTHRHHQQEHEYELERDLLALQTRLDAALDAGRLSERRVADMSERAAHTEKLLNTCTEKLAEKLAPARQQKEQNLQGKDQEQDQNQDQEQAHVILQDALRALQNGANTSLVVAYANDLATLKISESALQRRAAALERRLNDSEKEAHDAEQIVLELLQSRARTEKERQHMQQQLDAARDKGVKLEQLLRHKNEIVKELRESVAEKQCDEARATQAVERVYAQLREQGENFCARLNEQRRLLLLQQQQPQQQQPGPALLDRAAVCVQHAETLLGRVRAHLDADAALVSFEGVLIALKEQLLEQQRLLDELGMEHLVCRPQRAAQDHLIESLQRRLIEADNERCELRQQRLAGGELKLECEEELRQQAREMQQRVQEAQQQLGLVEERYERQLIDAHQQEARADLFQQQMQRMQQQMRLLRTLSNSQIARLQIETEQVVMEKMRQQQQRANVPVAGNPSEALRSLKEVEAALLHRLESAEALRQQLEVQNRTQNALVLLQTVDEDSDEALNEQEKWKQRCNDLQAQLQRLKHERTEAVQRCSSNAYAQTDADETQRLSERNMALETALQELQPLQQQQQQQFGKPLRNSSVKLWNELKHSKLAEALSLRKLRASTRREAALRKRVHELRTGSGANTKAERQTETQPQVDSDVRIDVQPLLDRLQQSQAQLLKAKANARQLSTALEMELSKNETLLTANSDLKDQLALLRQKLDRLRVNKPKKEVDGNEALSLARTLLQLPPEVLQRLVILISKTFEHPQQKPKLKMVLGALALNPISLATILLQLPSPTLQTITSMLRKALKQDWANARSFLLQLDPAELHKFATELKQKLQQKGRVRPFLAALAEEVRDQGTITSPVLSSSEELLYELQSARKCLDLQEHEHVQQMESNSCQLKLVRSELARSERERQHLLEECKEAQQRVRQVLRIQRQQEELTLQRIQRLQCTHEERYEALRADKKIVSEKVEKLLQEKAEVLESRDQLMMVSSQRIERLQERLSRQSALTTALNKKLEHDKQEQQDAIKQLDQQHEMKLQQEIDNSARQASHFDRYRIEQEKVVSMFEVQVARLQSELVSVAGGKMAAKKAELLTELAQKDAIIHLLNESIRELRHSSSSCSEAASLPLPFEQKNADADIGTLGLKLKAKSAELEQVKSECTVVRQQLQRRNDELKEARSILEQMQQSETVLSEAQQELVDELKRCKAEKAAEASQHSQNSGKLKQQVRALNAKLKLASESKQQCESLRQSVAELQARLSAVGGRRQGLERLCASRERVINELRERLERLTQADEGVRGAQHQLQAKISALQALNARKDAQIANLQHQLQTLQGEGADPGTLEEFQQQVLEQAKQVRKLQTAISRKQERIGILQKSNEDLQQQVQQHLQLQQQADNALHDKTRHLRKCKNEYAEVEKALRARSETLQQAMAAVASSVSSLLLHIQQQKQQQTLQLAMTVGENDPSCANIDLEKASESVPELSVNELECLLSPTSPHRRMPCDSRPSASFEARQHELDVLLPTFLSAKEGHGGDRADDACQNIQRLILKWLEEISKCAQSNS